MEENRVRALAALMKDMGLTALELSEGDFHLRMERGVAPAPQLPSGPRPESGRDQKAEPEATNLFTVTSPMVGLFYGAPAQGAKPFVSCGDAVRTGDVVCVIEAMKMMNEITAGASGIVTEVCAGDGQVVEYGHPLFRIRRMPERADMKEKMKGESEP